MEVSAVGEAISAVGQGSKTVKLLVRRSTRQNKKASVRKLRRLISAAVGEAGM